MKFQNWQETAHYCEIVYGIYVDWEERFFHCPECDEPIYECDWGNHEWTMCPVCEFEWEECEE